MIPSSYCRTSIFGEKFKFQYVRRDIHIYIATQNIILAFFVKVSLCLAKYIWKSLLTFGTAILFELLACMYSEPIGSFKDKSCLTGYVPELN